MARISTYSLDEEVSGGDKWIGSDSGFYNKTKNFTPLKLADYFNSSEKIDSSNSLRFWYQTLDPLEVRSIGTLSFEEEVGASVPFSGISSFLLSKNTEGIIYIYDFFNSLIESKILLHKSDTINTYAIYEVVGIEEYDENNEFIKVSVSFIRGNGGLLEDKSYLISVVDFALEASLNWGNIEGTLSDQTDLQDALDLKADTSSLGLVAFSNDYNDLDNLPTIPEAVTKTSDLTNDGEDGVNPFITLEDIPPIDISTLVPYTGATTDVDLGENGISAGFFKFDTTPTDIPEVQGAMFWDEDDNTVDVILNGYRMKIGEDTFYPVKNQSGSTITKGTNVKFAGTVGSSGRLLILPFLANGTDPSYVYMGVTAEDIADGEDGKVLWFGRLRGLNTNAFNEGDILYASTTSAGGFQTAIPTGANNIVQVSAVIKKSVNQGVIFIRPQIEPLLFKPENVANKSTTTTLGTSDTLYPTQNAVKVYADTKVDKDFSALPTASLPLSSSDTLVVNQGGVVKEVAVSNVGGKRVQLISDCSGWQLNTALTFVTVSAASGFSWNVTNQLKNTTPGNTTDAVALIQNNMTTPLGIVAYNSKLKRLTLEARFSYYRPNDRFLIGYFTKVDSIAHLTPTVLYNELVEYGNGTDGLYQRIEIDSDIEIPAGALLVYAIASNDSVSSTIIQRFYALHTLIELEEI
jgi:urease beta subunit